MQLPLDGDTGSGENNIKPTPLPAREEETGAHTCFPETGRIYFSNLDFLDIYCSITDQNAEGKGREEEQAAPGGQEPR